MSVKSLQNPQTPPTRVFFTPSALDIDSSRYSNYIGTIESLMIELQRKGPLVALNKIGMISEAMHSAKKIGTIASAAIRWDLWECRETFTDVPEDSQPCPLIVVGAKIAQGKGYVFFSPSVDVTDKKKASTRRYQPTSQSIFILSHEVFKACLENVYPPTVKENEGKDAKEETEKPVQKEKTKKLVMKEKKTKAPIISAAYMDSTTDEYIVKINALPIPNPEKKNVLTAQKKAEEATCMDLGKKMFERLKHLCAGSSWSSSLEAGMYFEVALGSCDSVLREKYLKDLWKEIGDENWTLGGKACAKSA